MVRRFRPLILGIIVTLGITLGTDTKAELSCRTLGWTTAIAEAATHDSYQDSNLHGRLRSLTSRVRLGALQAELATTLPAREVQIVIAFMADLHTRIARPRYVSDPATQIAAIRVISLLQKYKCTPTPNPSDQHRGQRREDAGNADIGGRIFAPEDRNVFFRPEAIKRALYLSTICVAVVGVFFVFRFSLKVKRRRKRHICRLDCTVVDGKTRRRARLHDISEAGCKLGPIPGMLPGATVVLWAGKTEKAAKVNWISGGSTVLRFVEPLSPDGLAQIRSSADRQNKQKRRMRLRARLRELACEF